MLPQLEVYLQYTFAFTPSNTLQSVACVSEVRSRAAVPAFHGHASDQRPCWVLGATVQCA